MSANFYSETGAKIQFRSGDSIVLNRYMGEGYWNVLRKNESFEMKYDLESNMASPPFKELIRFVSEHWILIGTGKKCWIRSDDASIEKVEFEYCCHDPH